MISVAHSSRAEKPIFHHTWVIDVIEEKLEGIVRSNV